MVTRAVPVEICLESLASTVYTTTNVGFRFRSRGTLRHVLILLTKAIHNSSNGVIQNVTLDQHYRVYGYGKCSIREMLCYSGVCAFFVPAEL